MSSFCPFACARAMFRRWRARLEDRLPLVIAITGSIGSGKSTVGRALQQEGVVIDTDDLAHELMSAPCPAYDAVLRRFGSDVAAAPGAPIDRKRLGRKVFDDPQALNDLNSIMHPAILELARQRIDEARRGGRDSFLLVPLLFESGWHLLKNDSGNLFFDETWCIVIGYSRQVALLCQRNGISEAEAKRLIAKQWSTQQKAKLSTRLIDNNGTLEATGAQALSCLAAARKSAGRC